MHTSLGVRKSANSTVIGAGREIVAYCRVSSDEQRAHGLGLEAQLVAIGDYAARVQGRIVASYREVVSARRDTLRNRPELMKALAHARRSGALLAFARWDRLARNVSITAQLLESHVDFVACDNPYANRLTIHILAAMAEYESQLKSERIKDVFALMKARGHVFPPGKFTEEARKLGNQRATEVIRERTKIIYADLVPLIVSLRSQDYTLDEIANQLNGLGHRNQRKHPWSRGNLWMLLRREGMTALAARRAPCGQHLGELTRIRARQANAAVIPIAVSLYRDGKTTSFIAALLNRRGHKTTRWNQWMTARVLELLRREGINIRPVDPADLRLRIAKAVRHSIRNRKARTRIAYRAALPTANRLRRQGKAGEVIAAALNRRKLCSSNGQPWNEQKVWVMLSSNAHRTR